MVSFRYLSVLLGFSLTHGILAVDPVVHLSYSSFRGTVQPDGVSQWLGIPFAAPPVGSLRFAPPVDPPHQNGIREANKQGPLCIATGRTTIPSGQSEDCLYLAVYAPSSAKPSSKLPVFVFIQGGGFNSNANPNLNGAGLIQASGGDIVVVTFNYRVGPWGFLASNTTEKGLPVTNNGLRDQRKAFEWVQQHIAAFGGDPNHVTIGGDSAGAASVSLHLTAYGGRDDRLFHAAAAESVSFATVLTPADSQFQYTNFANDVGCGHQDVTKSLACLRAKSAAELQAHNINIPYLGESKAPLYLFNPSLDMDIITDLTYLSFAKGNFIRVPVIFGDDTNGGTVFAPRDTSTQKESNNFLTQQFPYLTSSQLQEIDGLYPNANESACPAKGCWWRQAADAYGEMRYMCPSLYISSAYANASSYTSKHVGGGSARTLRRGTQTGAKSWAYRYNVEDPAQVAQGLGVPHTVELNAIFGPYNVPQGSAPASYFSGQLNAPVVPVIQAYWTSFIKHFDPNVQRHPRSAEWSQYLTTGEPERLLFETGGSTTMERVDKGQRMRCAYLQEIGPSIKQRRS